MSITLTQAKKLTYGDVLHHATAKNADDTPMRFRVTGQVKLWKRNPERIRVPLKHGLYDYGELVNKFQESRNGFSLNLDMVSIPD